MIQYKIERKRNNLFICNARLKNNDICICKISISPIEKTWTISSWFTKKEFGNQGIGSKTLHILLTHLYELYGIPNNINYIWNGNNNYVLEWMEKHFDATCKCPLSVLKTQESDSWDAHIYTLNPEKVLDYFHVDYEKNSIER